MDSIIWVSVVFIGIILVYAFGYFIYGIVKYLIDKLRYKKHQSQKK